jgi:hypothetical protein
LGNLSSSCITNYMSGGLSDAGVHDDVLVRGDLLRLEEAPDLIELLEGAVPVRERRERHVVRTGDMAGAEEALGVAGIVDEESLELLGSEDAARVAVFKLGLRIDLDGARDLALSVEVVVGTALHGTNFVAIHVLGDPSGVDRHVRSKELHHTTRPLRGGVGETRSRRRDRP